MNTKMFFKVFLKSIPFGLGIVLSLISIAFTVSIADSGGSEETVTGAIFFGLLGFPMLIAGALKLTGDLNFK
jgi:uncharacterized membrane protein